MNAADFARAGLYDPDGPNAPDRLRLLVWLADRGATLEQMIEANRAGVLPYLAGGLALRPGPYLTMREVADRIGVPLAQVEAFRLAFGLPPVAPDAAAFTESEAELFGRFTSGIDLFGEKGMLRLARVLGSSLARITEAMVTTNREDRLTPLLSAGTSELAFAQANLRAIETAGAPATMIQGLLPVHLELAASRLRRGRRSASAQTAHACVGFVDLVGSTTLSRRLSAAELAAVVERFEDVTHDLATARRGRVVKFIGDEVMFVTADATAACDIALALIEEFATDPNVTPRGGLAEGELLDRGGDYYGPVVNLAARLAELAVPREVLVSQEIAAHATGAGLRCEPAGRRLLRGFDAPVTVLSVTRA
jgi:class 3 adenylate cyclase